MKFLVLKGASEFWVQGDDGQLVELTNITRFETTYEAELWRGNTPVVSGHLEFRYLDIEYVSSLPIKEKPATDIRKRTLR